MGVSGCPSCWDCTHLSYSEHELKIPKKLKIGGHHYKVIYPYQFRELSTPLGQSDHTINEIRLKDVDSGGLKRVDSQVYVTLIHEIMHGLDRLTGQFWFEDDKGENYLHSLSEMIYQFLTDNEFLK